jgi:hypothetical protein
MRYALPCYVERRGDWWEAACPALNFAARGNSILEAHERLARRIQKYARYVETLPEKDRETAYRSRAPLYARASRAISGVLAGFSSSSRRDSGRYRIPYTFPGKASI